MDQKKNGKFIAELRKEKKMTQQELASKIGVTDRAISNWENGRRMPELSLMKPLCDELGITINELLSGEKLEQQEYQTKFEENILNTIDYSAQKINKVRKQVMITLSVIGAILIILLSMFLIDVIRMNYSQPVIFSTWGFKYCPPIDFPDKEIKLSILEYLNNRYENEKMYEDEKNFVNLRIYLTEEVTRGNLYNVYAWVLHESYYPKDGEILQEGSASIPYKFVVEKSNEKYIVIDSRTPRDGSLEEDMNALFPKSVRRDMLNVYDDGTVERLHSDIEKQVELYFD